MCITLNSVAQSKYIVEANDYYNRNMYCEGAAKCILAYSKIKKSGNQALKAKGDMAFKTAECYRMTDRFKDANEWYERALLLEYQKINPEIFYNNGEMLRMNGDFDKALKNFEEYKLLVPNDVRGDLAILNCKEAKNFINDKTRHVITNQGSINKKGIDMAPTFDVKENRMYFATSRDANVGSLDPISCDKYMDIWVTDFDKNGNWSEPKPVDLTGVVNTGEHEGSVSFDAKKTMFFTRCPDQKKQNLGCDIWMVKRSGKDEWEEAVKCNLKQGLNDSVSVGHPCVMEDGLFMIFASDMPGGIGGKDLWYSTFDKKNDTWRKPINLGKGINTEGNELFPTFGKDGKLYYSSDGMKGLGGLDIYAAKKIIVADTFYWENPINLKFPINSENNDYSLYEFDERKGYFTSERKDPNGVFNADIYSYELPPNLFDLRVIVSERIDKAVKIPDVKVTVTGSDGSKWEGYTKKDGSTQLWDKKADGKRYVNANVKYQVSVAKEGYYENKKKEEFTTEGLNDDQSFVIEMDLIPIKKPIRLPEVRYVFNQWVFVNDSTIQSNDSLIYVYNLLKDNPEIILELSSHTDARGTADANQRLSENRARACYKYLVEEKGVDPRRIVPAGKGESVPRTVYKKGDEYLTSQPIDMTGVETIVLNETYINQFKTSNKALFETLHQLNRRTEGAVLRTDFDPAVFPPADAKFFQFVKYP
jgi:outer membrane protein OmpA-like peptidoglycan-associated protein/tetratricopeptide (TPR) repeat protein